MNALLIPKPICLWATLASFALVILDELAISNPVLGAYITCPLYNVQQTIYSLNLDDNTVVPA